MAEISVADPDPKDSARSGFELFSSAGSSSVADPYHLDMDPDPGSEKICYRSGSRANFDTDPDSGKNDTDPEPAKKG